MNARDHTQLIKIALDAVLAGAKLADGVSQAQVVGTKGNLRDVVTQTDLEISTLIEKRLAGTGLPVISEEQKQVQQTTPEQFWVVDPIDGSVNFAHGIPAFTISAGLVEAGQFALGVVCAPRLDELYFTLNSERALLNGRPFTHGHRALEDALVAASFSARPESAQFDLFGRINQSTRGCLRTGSASLNICWAATGKLQAAYGFRAKLWDVAGALAIARAAGCELALRYTPGALELDYCVGSREVVAHLIQQAHACALWGQA